MDTSWIKLPNSHPAYIDGCMKFLELAKEDLVHGKTRCPCKNCKVRKWLPINQVEGHILFGFFFHKYTNWIFHGKGDILERMHVSDIGSSSVGSLVGRDDIEGLLEAALGVHIPHSPTQPENEFPMEPIEVEGEHDDVVRDSNTCHGSHQPPSLNTSEEEAKYKRLFEASNEELYKGCKTFSKLSFLLRLFHLKCMFHWSNESVNKLIELLTEAFPQIREFPSSYYEGKKIINDLGLGYEKIHACPNNCMLYWGEFSEKEQCHVCQTSRWKTVKGKEGETSEQGNDAHKKGEAAKVMRYFPLIPRMKRIYMSSKTAEDMRWHDKDRVDDGKLRHPADASAWKDFDALFPDFSCDPRSVRLGLATDGFNPYRLMSTTYSSWPVVLIPYNLPPWLCMKPSSFILSCIIPGKSGPGNDIDVYLQPLLYELKLLWEGVDAFDAYSGTNFKLRGALHGTIHDFPGYGMLSGWSTQGYNACPSCTNSTYSSRFGNKICFIGHRKWLPQGHPYRSQDSMFDGNKEYGDAPISASGSDILRQQEGIEYIYGKKQKRPKKKRQRREVGTSTEVVNDGCGEDDKVDVLWNKKSKFFDLPYWEHNPLRHNLDVMHIEKNVCDNILGTLLDTDKSRDDGKARQAIKDRGIKQHLWPQPQPNGESNMPPASYTMPVEEKERFLKVLQKIRAPDGYGSNLSRCVNLKQRKLQNLKSHDNHVLMQDILPIALRASKSTKVIDFLGDLSAFFKYLCSPTLDPKELDALQSRIVVVLCRMELEFLPTFFTVMVHLLVHLVEEAKLGGPVHYRWMYPIERYLAHLKSYVSNKAQPEGSIAEGYILEETITFCSRYLEGMETIFNRPRRNDGGVPNMSSYLYNSGTGRVIGMQKNIRLDDKSLKQAHRYVLLHSAAMKEVLDEFLHQKRQENYSRIDQINENVENEWIINEFADWLLTQVHNLDSSTEDGQLRKALAGGPSNFGKRMKGFMINGYKFQTVDCERYRKTQNSGIMVEADGKAYYGKLKEIYELDYYGVYKVVMFRCDWVDIHRGLKTYQNGSVCVNFSKLMHTGRNLRDDPFVFSSQAKQVFYVEDEMQKGWLHVIKTKPRDLFD